MMATDAPLPVRTHSPAAWIALVLAAIGVVAVAVALVGGGGSAGGGDGAPSPAVGSPPTEALAALGEVERVSDAPLLDDGRPILFFMGAQYCPFCAAQRWALIEATSRFGVWSGVEPFASPAGMDGFSSVPTYDLTAARFTSDVLSVRTKEIADASGGRLQDLDDVEAGLVDAFNPRGSVPFIAATGTGGQYTIDLAYSPGLLQGDDFDEIRQAVGAGEDSAAVRAISGQADAITAVLCTLTGGQPASACGTPVVTELMRRLT